MTIQIISKKDGFRRCGIAHPASMVLHPDGRFTPAQIEQLQAEPRLIVEIVSKTDVPDQPPKTKAYSGQGMVDPPTSSHAGKQGKKSKRAR